MPHWMDYKIKDLANLTTRGGEYCLDGTPVKEIVQKMVDRGLVRMPTMFHKIQFIYTNDLKKLPNKPPFPVRTQP